MLSLLFLIPIALTVTAGLVALLFWAVNNGQYDDLERAGREVLYDDDLMSGKPRHQDSD